MIEVLALAGAVTKIAGGISSAIKAGKDINGVMGSFGQLAKLESEIHLAESGKHKGPLGRMTSSEAEARKRHKLALEEQAEKRDKIFWLISVIFGFLIVTIGTGGLIWGAAILAQGRS